MGKFILGVIVTLLVLVLGGLGYRHARVSSPPPPMLNPDTWNAAWPWEPSTPPWSVTPRASITR